MKEQLEEPNISPHHEGLRHFTKRTLQGLVVAALVVKALDFTGDAIDRSPTFVKFRQEQERVQDE